MTVCEALCEKLGTYNTHVYVRVYRWLCFLDEWFSPPPMLSVSFLVVEDCVAYNTYMYMYERVGVVFSLPFCPL